VTEPERPDWLPTPALSTAIGALALLLLLPSLAVLLAVPRKILLLLGRTYR